MKLRRVLSAFAAASVALTLTVSSVSAKEVWSGSKDVGTSWSEYVEVEGLSPTAGQILTVDFTINSGADGQLIVKDETDGWPALECHKNTTHAGYNGDVIALSAGETSVSYVLTANDCTNIKNTKLLVAGSGITIKSVDISDPAPAEPEKPAESADSASYNVSTAMVVQDSVTWATQKSAEVKIDKDGEYTYTLSGLSIDPSKLNVLYIKDAEVIDGDKDGYKSDINTSVTVKSLKINGKDVAVSSGYNTPLSDAGVFDLCVYNIWSADDTLITLPTDTIKDVEMILTVGAASTDEPAAPAEPTVEPDEPDEPTVEPDEPTAEPDEPDEETVEPTVEAEPDWDSYDADAAKAANEAFTFATNETIDLYSVLGEDIYNLAKVDATFTWTAGTGWCGGAGLGNGAVTENGDTWISGPEYGCANANADLVDAGTATQTILDITDNAIVDAASVNEDGETTFAALFVQNWWNGAEAGAKLTKLSFTDADGNVLGELTWGEDAAEAPSNTAAPANDSKGSPDTGVAGVAAAAGVAALAGVAVVVARKRK